MEIEVDKLISSAQQPIVPIFKEYRQAYFENNRFLVDGKSLHWTYNPNEGLTPIFALLQQLTSRQKKLFCLLNFFFLNPAAFGQSYYHTQQIHL